MQKDVSFNGEKIPAHLIHHAILHSGHFTYLHNIV